MSVSKMEEGKVFVVSGPSGSGKGTVIGILQEIYTGMEVAVSATTRAPREGEAEGVNYFYKTKAEFEELIKNDEVLEYTIYNGNYYGTLKSEAERITEKGKDLVLEIEVNGCGQMKRKLGSRCVAIMLTAPDSKELERRLRGRGTETEDEIQRRLRRALDEVKEVTKYDYLLINENGKADKCAEDLLAVITAERLKADRAEEYLRENYPEI